MENFNDGSSSQAGEPTKKEVEADSDVVDLTYEDDYSKLIADH